MNAKIDISDVRKFFDWEPVTVPDTYEWQGETRTTGLQKVLHPDGDYLGTRSVASQPHAYRQWLVDNTELITDDKLEVINYGQLGGWKKAYIQIATSDVTTVGGVAFRPFITASTSMDGTFATSYGWNRQIIVCANTFAAARTEQNKHGKAYKVKATKNSRFEVLKARQALDILFEDTDDFAAQLDVLLNEEVSDKKFAWFVEAWDMEQRKGKPLPEKGRGLTISQNRRERLHELWNGDERVTPWRGTKFGVLQAVNTWEHHDKTVKGDVTRNERNILRTMSGDWDGVESDVYRLLASV